MSRRYELTDQEWNRLLCYFLLKIPENQDVLRKTIV